MKVLFTIAALWAGTASAMCQDIYDPFNDEWVYECTPQPADARPPVCHQQFDPINSKWVTVCS